MSRLDPELETEAEFIHGDADDADQLTDAEALGARHRRRFGYTSEGAAENDMDILNKGRKPQSIPVHRSAVPESRMHAFTHGHSPGEARITTVKKR